MVLWPNFGHCTTTINVWERMGEKHLAQLMGEGACQPDIFTKYRLGSELSYGSCPISFCVLCNPDYSRCSLHIHITYNLYCATKWPFPRSRELDFGLEFERNGFEEHFIFTEGSSKPIRDDQVIRVAGDGLLYELNI